MGCVARVVLTAMIVVAFLLAACSGSTPAEAPPPETPPATISEEEQSVLDQIEALYDKARDAGGEVSEDVYEWARDDFKSFGDWEYLVEEMPASTDAVRLTERLNELGAERWECIWIESTGANTRYLFKRPTRSYLRQLPLSQLLKLVPGGGGDAPE